MNILRKKPAVTKRMIISPGVNIFNLKKKKKN